MAVGGSSHSKGDILSIGVCSRSAQEFRSAGIPLCYSTLVGEMSAIFEALRSRSAWCSGNKAERRFK